MKTKLVLAACLLFSSLGYAQDIAVKDVPAAVMNAFNRAFPKAVKVEWEMKGDLYNADFDVERRDHEVWLNNKGAIVKHKQELRSRELPAVVSQSLKKNFKGFWIDDVDKYEVAKQFFYKVELKTMSQEKNVVLDSKGQTVNRIL
ncbi:PepSY-like domain-containing protein [Pedobacter heparinus]|uniref:PepSY-like domain-containing protein n=1 Tax=Pedobacter heparinus TaxID=984 RepID=UPI00292CBB49|nr:PepSY-like domain-containing protein [Pedobacter heparinus]